MIRYITNILRRTSLRPSEAELSRRCVVHEATVRDLRRSLAEAEASLARASAREIVLRARLRRERELSC